MASYGSRYGRLLNNVGERNMLADEVKAAEPDGIAQKLPESLLALR